MFTYYKVNGIKNFTLDEQVILKDDIQNIRRGE